jgi:hypothetical protein
MIIYPNQYNNEKDTIIQLYYSIGNHGFQMQRQIIFGF